ncbi:MAG TPA: cupredoxin family copper-binding protein [Solirubrobacterales bacterium]|nr:cupredoxin family copper-binding protein [Solirubrobacterales bacterium]
MRLSPVLPALVLVVLGLALAGCGDDDDSGGGDGSGGETTATAPEESGTPETEGGSQQGANAPAPSGDAVRAEKVEIVEFIYEPDPVTIEAGGKVTWINRDSAPHTATADDGSFDTGALEEGKLGSESFKDAGSYPYFCEIHPDMRGTVEVVEPG